MEKLTLSRLAKALNTSPSAIYRYFSSKDELVSALSALALGHAVVALPREDPSTLTDITDFRTLALAQILRRFAHWYRYRRQHRVSYALLMSAVQRRGSAHVAELDGLLGYFDEALDHAVRVAALRPEPSRPRSVLLLAALHGLQPREDRALERELLHTLLCGWGAPRHMLEALAIPALDDSAS
jgi:AcrR family transcriptional regulator